MPWGTSTVPTHSCDLRGIKEICMDWKVDIYIKTDNKSLAKKKRWISYVLGTMFCGELKTIEYFGTVEETLQGAQLTAIVAALKRMKRPAEIVIHVESSFIVNMFKNHMAEWAAGGWQSPLHNKEEWKQLYEYSQLHQITFDTEPHVYGAWQLDQMNRRAKTREL